MEKKSRASPAPNYDSARRLRIADIVRNEDDALRILEESHLAKLKIFGTVMSRRIFKSEGKVDYAYLTVDDGSGSVIKVKAWGSDVGIIEKVQQGDMVDVLGKVRRGEKEIYIIPEIVSKIDDPNWETVRELEIIEDYLRQNKAYSPQGGALGFSTPSLESKILERIESEENNAGIEYSELAKSIEHSNEEEIKKALRELLSRGLICEPRPGRYRK